VVQVPRTLTGSSPLSFLPAAPPKTFWGEITVTPVTSTIRDIPSEVLLGREDGMPRECAVNLDHIQTVSKGRIDL
jgi:mRNA interferase MazF